MRTNIVKIGAPVLRKPTAPIVEIDNKTIRLAHNMVKIMKEANGLGLAANQVGYSKRLFVFGEGHVVINPTIVKGDTPVVGNEGCLSIPGKQFKVWRFKNIVMTGMDLEGNSKEWTTSDLLARLFQHELDHLNGKLIVDYPVSNGEVEAVVL